MRCLARRSRAADAQESRTVPDDGAVQYSVLPAKLLILLK